MKKEELYASFREKYGELKTALAGTDIKRIRELTRIPRPINKPS